MIDGLSAQSVFSLTGRKFKVEFGQISRELKFTLAKKYDVSSYYSSSCVHRTICQKQFKRSNKPAIVGSIVFLLVQASKTIVKDQNYFAFLADSSDDNATTVSSQLLTISAVGYILIQGEIET